MGFSTLLTLATLALAPLGPTGGADGTTLAQAQPQTQPFITTQGMRAPQGNFMTDARGCVYRKTQAPGYPPRWILVVNPQRLGFPPPPRGCGAMR